MLGITGTDKPVMNIGITNIEIANNGIHFDVKYRPGYKNS